MSTVPTLYRALSGSVVDFIYYSPDMPKDAQGRQEFLDSLGEDIDHAVVFKVDNVNEYAAHHTPEGHHRLEKLCTGARIMPPYEVLWFEFTAYGVVSDSAEKIPMDETQEIPIGALVQLVDADMIHGASWVPKETKRGIVISPFSMDLDDGHVIAGHSVWIVPLGEDGRSVPTGDPMKDLRFRDHLDIANQTVYEHKMYRYDYRAFDVAIMALAFLNIQNIRLIDNRPPRQQMRDTERRGQKVVKWKTLQITKPGQTRVGSSSYADHDPRALHIVRGHFATYTPERPLFGRHTGTFWINAHVRGSEDQGVVLKDYRTVGVRK